VYYDYQTKRSDEGYDLVDPKTPFPYPGWLRPLTEELVPPLVVSVILRDTATTDGDLEHLRSLSCMGRLDLANTKVTDEGLEVVGRLSRLSSLTLAGTQIGDDGVSHLRHLQLVELGLSRTTISDLAV
jgi:hypothetical protein